MEQPKTKKEEIQGLLNKIHELRSKKLLTVEYLESEMHKIVTIIGDLNAKLDKIATDLQAGTIDKGTAIILCKILETRKSILEGYKSCLKECRMAITLLIKEEGKLTFELIKAQTETS